MDNINFEPRINEYIKNDVLICVVYQENEKEYCKMLKCSEIAKDIKNIINLSITKLFINHENKETTIVSRLYINLLFNKINQLNIN